MFSLLSNSFSPNISCFNVKAVFMGILLTSNPLSPVVTIKILLKGSVFLNITIIDINDKERSEAL